MQKVCTRPVNKITGILLDSKIRAGITGLLSKRKKIEVRADWRIYVCIKEIELERILLSLIQQFRSVTTGEREIFRSRVQAFAADSQSREIVEFVFDHDPENEIFTIRDSGANPQRSDLNGGAVYPFIMYPASTIVENFPEYD